MFGKPQLGNDFTRAQVAAKALVTGGAKPATYRATGLRRNTQRATVFFGDKNGFDGVAIANVKQPFDGAIGRYLLGFDCQRFDFGHPCQFVTQRLGQVAHVGKIGRATLVNPAKQLFRTEWLFAQIGAKCRQAVVVQFE